MKNVRSVTVDLRCLSKDTRALLRWVARDESSIDDDERGERDVGDSLVGVDEALLRRVERKLRRMRFRLDADEADCLSGILESIDDRLGEANLKDVYALMRGDDEAYMEPYPYLPDQPEADPERQDKELTRLHQLLSSRGEPGQGGDATTDEEDEEDDE